MPPAAFCLHPEAKPAADYKRPAADLPPRTQAQCAKARDRAGSSRMAPPRRKAVLPSNRAEPSPSRHHQSRAAPPSPVHAPAAARSHARPHAAAAHRGTAASRATSTRSPSGTKTPDSQR